MMGSASITAESSEQPKEQPKAVRGRPFPRGVSGNPKGRPQHALSEAVRRRSDPDELADIALKIARTSKSEAMRMQALSFLRDSGYSRPPSAMQIGELPDEQPDLSGVSDERLAAILVELQGADGSGNGRSSAQPSDTSSESPSVPSVCAGGEQPSDEPEVA